MLILIFLILIVGCSNNLSGNILAEKQTDEIKIGGIYHLTGPGAFWGQTEKDASLLAINDINQKGGINGKKIKLIIEDSQTDPKSVASSISKLTQIDDVKLIIGPTWHSQIASPLTKQYKVPMISPSGGTVPEPSEYFFDLWPTENQETIRIAKYLKENNIDEIILVYTLQDWSISMRDNFIISANENGITILEEFAVDAFETDFSTIIQKIEELDAKGIYSIFAFYQAQGEFSKELSQSKLNLTHYSTQNTQIPALLEAYPQIEGTIYTYTKETSKQEEFNQRFYSQYGYYPGPSSAHAYDSVMLAANATETHGENSKAIKDYLSQVKYEGLTGTIEFDENGRIKERDYVIKKVENGEFVMLE